MRAVLSSIFPEAVLKSNFSGAVKEQPSSLTAELPLVDLTLDEPVVEGDLVYFAVRIESPFGMEALVFSKSIELTVNGAQQTADPTEVLEGDAILVIWEWADGSGGQETVNVSVAYEFQEGLVLTGSSDFEIETFDGAGTGGGFYPCK
jgi:hypothetical protein